MAWALERRQFAFEVPTHMTERELVQLHWLAAGRRTALEIGSYLGASTRFLASALPPGGLTCVDTWQNETVPEGRRDTWAEFAHNTRGLDVRTIRARSDQVDPVDVGRVDLLFLDGDHSYEVVSGEVARFGSLLAVGGLLVFHDAVEFEGVARTIGETLATGKWKLRGALDNLCWLERSDSFEGLAS